MKTVNWQKEHETILGILDSTAGRKVKDFYTDTRGLSYEELGIAKVLNSMNDTAVHNFYYGESI